MVEPVKIVLTGGPCSGKSTMLKYLKTKLMELGYYVVTIQETATKVLLEYGMTPAELGKLPRERYMELQGLMTATQIREEAEAAEYAEKFCGEKKIIILCDRGIPDGAAYTTPQEYKDLLVKNRLNRVTAREARYDVVLHLETAAVGAEQFYNLRNDARLEKDALTARQVEEATRRCYLGHTHVAIVPSCEDFEFKQERAWTILQSLLGIPRKIETERKFVVRATPDFQKFPVPFQPILIHQNYFKGEGLPRIRQRGEEHEGNLYYLTIKTPTEVVGSELENEQRITSREFYRRVVDADPDFDLIYKTRNCFIWGNQYFELDVFHLPTRHDGLVILEIELHEKDAKVEIPDWLGPVTEVTNDPKYKNSNLAKRP